MENNHPPAQPQTSRTSHNEPLFGTILFVAMILFVILSAVGILWAGYLGWRSHQQAVNQPSITTLADEPKEEVKEETASLPTTPAPAETATQTEADVTKAKATAVTVQNGGGAKGSAGALAETLKKAGYTKVTAGNTQTDYTAVTLYYTTGLEKEAAVLKETVIKTYPAVTLAPAMATNKETSVSPLTIILGK